MEFRKAMSERYRELRDKLSESSIASYVSRVSSLVKKLKLKQDLNTFKDEDSLQRMIDHLKDPEMNEHSRKSTLAGLFVLTGDERFENMMLKSLEKVQAHYKTRELSVKEKADRVDYDHILQCHAKTKSAYRRTKDVSTAMDYLITSLTACVHPGLEIRRNEYSYLKLKNYDVLKDNYVQGHRLYFNQYKTACKYGRQVVELPRSLRPVLNFIRENSGHEYLFFNTRNGKPMRSSDWTLKLYQLYGKGVSTDQIRSLFISHGPLKEIENVARRMGHSVNQQLATYLKV